MKITSFETWHVNVLDYVEEALREALGDTAILMTDPVAEYTLEEAIAVGRQLERLEYRWFEEPFRDLESSSTGILSTMAA